VKVLSTAHDSASITSILSKWRSNQGNRNVIGDHIRWKECQSCYFWSKIPWWKRRCETVHCRDATASSFVAKVQGKVFTHFHAVTVKCHSSIWKWLFDLWEWILYEQPPWCQRKWWVCSWLCSLPASCFLVSVSSDFSIQTPVYGSCFLPQMLVIAKIYHFFRICTRLDAPWLSDPSWNCIRPDIQLHIKGHKKSACPPSCMKFCTLTPKIC
jgi:hypothetical protein